MTRESDIVAQFERRLVVDLPYPHKLLWPNGRTIVPAARWKQADLHRVWANISTPRADVSDLPRPIPVHITLSRKAAGVYPDRDNVVAACKAYLDGIAQRLGINDRHFDTPTVEFIKPITGRVVIRIGEPEGGA